MGAPDLEYFSSLTGNDLQKQKEHLRGQASFTTHKGYTIPKAGLQRKEEEEDDGSKKKMLILLVVLVGGGFYYMNFM